MTWLLVYLLKVVVLCIEIFIFIGPQRLEPITAGGPGELATLFSICQCTQKALLRALFVCTGKWRIARMSLRTSCDRGALHYV